MKIILDRKIYDTEKAQEVASARHATPNNISWYQEKLFLSRNGSWFLAGEGGPLSHYGIDLSEGNKEGGRKLIPLPTDQVIIWLEQHGNYSVIEEYFFDQLEVA